VASEHTAESSDCCVLCLIPFHPHGHMKMHLDTVYLYAVAEGCSIL
jgi:hypothetical protein